MCHEQKVFTSLCTHHSTVHGRTLMRNWCGEVERIATLKTSSQVGNEMTALEESNSFIQTVRPLYRLEDKNILILLLIKELMFMHKMSPCTEKDRCMDSSFQKRHCSHSQVKHKTADSCLEDKINLWINLVSIWMGHKFPTKNDQKKCWMQWF